MKVTKTLSMDIEHAQWIEDKDINLSKWVRKRIKKQIEQEKQNVMAI